MSTTEQAVEDLLSEQDWTGKIFSDGWVDAPETIETIEPATGDVLGTAGVGNAASIADATASAAVAQRAWAALPIGDRIAVVSRAGELLDRHRDEIAGWMIRESGCIPPKADHEIGASIGQLEQAAGLASEQLDRVLESPIPGRTSTARRVPIGVVGVITPWNFPIVLAMRSIGPALALGNAVVLKSDLNTPVSGGVIIARIFEEAGLPSGVLHVIPGGPEVGQALVDDPNVRMISFTGSTATGRKVGESAGRSLKRVVLELGGNSPLIVLDDADIVAASSAGAWGSYLHQGQICLAVSRHLVHESIADEYVAACLLCCVAGQLVSDRRTQAWILAKPQPVELGLGLGASDLACPGRHAQPKGGRRLHRRSQRRRPRLRRGQRAARRTSARQFRTGRMRLRTVRQVAPS